MVNSVQRRPHCWYFLVSKLKPIVRQFCALATPLFICTPMLHAMNIADKPIWPHQALADSAVFPTPQGVPNLLFYIQRDPDANTVCYSLNMDKDGLVNQDQPFDIFWMRYAEDNRRKELNFLQQSFAYGVVIKKVSPAEIEFRSVAYDRAPLFLRKTKANYQVYAKIGGEECVLKRIYVHIDGGTFLNPNIVYVQLEGVNAKGKPKVEQLKP